MLVSMLSDLITRAFHCGMTAAKRRRLNAWLQRGYRYQREGNHSSARTMFERALLEQPANAHAHLLLGRLHGKQGNLGLAALHLEQAISANPELSDAHAALGSVRLLEGDKGAA